MSANRRDLFVWVSAVILLLLAAPILAASTYFNQVEAEKTLVVGLNADYPPFCIWYEGKPRGFDVEFAKTIAQKLGVTNLKFERVKPDEAVQALVDKKIDLAVAAMTVTSDRARKIAFSQPYYIATLAALLDRSKIPQTIVNDRVRPMPMTSILDLAGIEPLRIATKADTTVYRRAVQMFPSSTVTGYPDLRAALHALRRGRADALVHEDPYLRHYAAGQRGSVARFVVLKKPVTREKLAVAMRQGDPDFLRWLNVLIDELKSSGQFQTWEDTFFDHTDWREEAPW